MRRWHNNGPKGGLWYEIASTEGDRLDAATRESAEALVGILNRLEILAEGPMTIEEANAHFARLTSSEQAACDSVEIQNILDLVTANEEIARLRFALEQIMFAGSDPPAHMRPVEHFRNGLRYATMVASKTLEGNDFRPNRQQRNTPCVFCGHTRDEHGEPGASEMATSRLDRLCPVPGVTSQFYTPKADDEPTVKDSLTIPTSANPCNDCTMYGRDCVEAGRVPPCQKKNREDD